MNETELMTERKKAVRQGDRQLLLSLEQEASSRLEGFLNDEQPVDSDDSPFFFTFIRDFSETDNVELKMLAKKAEVKLSPLLKQFDREMGYQFKDLVPADVLERNLNDLDSFEKEDLTEQPSFRQILKLLEKIEQVDEDGNVMDMTDLKENIIAAAKLKTYLRLCLNSDKITFNMYFLELRKEMELLLITLFLMDKSEVSLDEEKIRKEFEKFLDAIE